MRYFIAVGIAILLVCAGLLLARLPLSAKCYPQLLVSSSNDHLLRPRPLRRTLMPKGYIICEDRCLGPFSYASQPDDSWGWMSSAYFCSECGEIWARVIIVSGGKEQPFRPVTQSCRKHPDPWNVQGSLLRGELKYNLATLSEECLARELDVHLAYYESLI